jgi:hypothetical protein
MELIALKDESGVVKGRKYIGQIVISGGYPYMMVFNEDRRWEKYDCDSFQPVIS